MTETENREKGRGFLRRTVFFLGWMLSPLSFWNDSFVNIPFSYFCATLTFHIVKVKFLYLVMLFYWFSNILGILLMWGSGRYIIKDKKQLIKEIFNILLTIIIYSAILAVLDKIGLLKPMKIL